MWWHQEEGNNNMDLMEENQEINSYAPVSVIIPCYNCEDSILRAVNSVIDQTWKPKEIILVNDGSKDNTLEILGKLQKKFGRDWIKIINLPENKGPSSARNAGWDIATQPYVAFLDADDAWHPDKIRVQLNYMLEHQDIVLTGHKVKYINSSYNVDVTPIVYNYAVKNISPLQLLIRNRFSTPSVILKNEIPFRFEYTKRFSEDYLLWLNIVFSGYKAVILELELAYLFKAPYGEGGLSSNLWKMELGELDTLRRICTLYKLNKAIWYLVASYSFMKFASRWIKCNIFNRRNR